MFFLVAGEGWLSQEQPFVPPVFLLSERGGAGVGGGGVQALLRSCRS